MIFENNKVFCIETLNTSYIFRVMETGHLEHLHYGKKIHSEDVEAITEKHVFVPGNAVNYSAEHENISLEDMDLEISSYGKGDIREPFIAIRYPDGSRTSDFLYDSFEISQGREGLETLPGPYGECEHLKIVLKEKHSDVQLILNYHVFSESDVITRNAILINNTGDRLRVDRLMSCQLDMSRNGMVVTTFNGAWAREFDRHQTELTAGKLSVSSMTGTSSNRANTLVLLAGKTTSEEAGDCYGMNLIYSGNHYETVEASPYGRTRFVSGINPDSFEYVLEPGEKLEAPEAVLTYSSNGYQGMSINMHHFVKENIIRGPWAKKERPILLNSWEAAYFDINEKKLVNLAKAGKEAGIELFVMDDGWFGTRDDDKQALGDWYENTKKLPGGVKGLADKIKALGMDFGIWVEPEMVNVNSKCYELHKDWVVDIPGREHSEGRSQRLLDLTNPEVQDYIIDQMSKVFSSADISYVKWDMNRIFSDQYSKSLSSDRQGEFAHRYVIGLYRTMAELTRRFPDILFEGCSAGGNRFDLGILCYFPQIWASDNTDALCRVKIQNNYSYGYPQCVMGAHVSGCPNHQTLRRTPLETRFNVAAFGVLGYECNFIDLSKEELEAVKQQTEIYKKWRKVLQYGDFYRGREGNVYEWTIVSSDTKKAVGMIMQNQVQPNTTREIYTAKGLDPDARYHFYNRELKHNIKEFGDLINTQTPVHIKPDSFAHNMVAKFVKMDGEKEDYNIYGDTLMNVGVALKQGFAATGYNSDIRFFQDHASRIYFMEQI